MSSYLSPHGLMFDCTEGVVVKRWTRWILPRWVLWIQTPHETNCCTESGCLCHISMQSPRNTGIFYSARFVFLLQNCNFFALIFFILNRKFCFIVIGNRPRRFRSSSTNGCSRSVFDVLWGEGEVDTTNREPSRGQKHWADRIYVFIATWSVGRSGFWSEVSFIIVVLYFFSFILVLPI